jgi:hypothetical protein
MSNSHFPLFAGMCALLSLPGAAHAAQIQPSDFTNPQVTTFDEPGIPPGTQFPFTLNGNTFTGDSAQSVGFRNSCFSGNCVSNNTDLGFIQVALGTPTTKAGAYLSDANGIWSVRGDFFDSTSTLLGSVTVSGADFPPVFIGFATSSGLITRVVFTDLTSNARVLAIDNFTTEGPALSPEPSSLVTLSCALIGLGAIARRRNQKRHA